MRTSHVTSSQEEIVDKFSNQDAPTIMAKKIIRFMENEGGFQSILHSDGQLDKYEKEYILEREYMYARGDYKRPPRYFDTAFIMSINIVEEMLAADPKDYFAILTLDPYTAEENFDNQLKIHYKKWALMYHPDKPTGDENKFKQLREAYEFLSDPEQRKQYREHLNPTSWLFPKEKRSALAQFNTFSASASSAKRNQQPKDQRDNGQSKNPRPAL